MKLLGWLCVFIGGLILLAVNPLVAAVAVMIFGAAMVIES